MTRRACLLTLTLLAAPAAAQLVPMGPEFRVDEGAGHRSCPEVAGRGDRGFTVAWRTEHPLHARSYNGAGVPLGGVVDVTQGRLTAFRHVLDIAVQNRPGQGDLVMWQSNENSGKSFRIENRVVFPALGPASTVQPPRYVQMVSPRRTGGFLGIWQGRRGWMAGALDASGRPVGRPVRVSSGTNLGFREVVHAVDGSFAMVWVDDAGIRLRRFGADLRPLGAEAGVVPPRTDVGRIVVAGGPDGRTVAAWSETDHDDGSRDLYVRFFAPDGSPESGRLPVESRLVADSIAFPEALAMNGQGRALIVWAELAPGDATLPEHFAVQLWSAAGPASEAMDLAADPISAINFPSFCADAAAAGRSFVVTWLGDDDDNVPATDTKAIYARRFFAAD